MQFREGTTVHTHDGQVVGSIERFILDPRGQQIIGLVVRKGFLLTEDKVIPVNMVGTANKDKVVLYADAGDPDNFPVFEEVDYVIPDATELSENNNRMFPYFPINMAGWSMPMIAPTPQKKRNIPRGTVPVKEGASVISSDGEHVGNIERVHTDAKTDEITHFIISQGLFFKEEKSLPSMWVDTARENEIHLAVNSKTLEKFANI